MIEIIVISGLFVAFVLFHIWYVKQTNEQLKFYIKASKAETFYEVMKADKEDKPIENIEPDVISTDNVDENFFNRMIQKELEIDEE